MELEDLHGLMKEQHGETNKKLDCLDEKLTEVRIQMPQMQTTKDCAAHMKEMDDKMRKVGFWNKVGALIATTAAGAVGWLLMRGRQ